MRIITKSFVLEGIAKTASHKVVMGISETIETWPVGYVRTPSATEVYYYGWYYSDAAFTIYTMREELATIQPGWSLLCGVFVSGTDVVHFNGFAVTTERSIYDYMGTMEFYYPTFLSSGATYVIATTASNNLQNVVGCEMLASNRVRCLMPVCYFSYDVTAVSGYNYYELFTGFVLTTANNNITPTLVSVTDIGGGRVRLLVKLAAAYNYNNNLTRFRGEISHKLIGDKFNSVLGSVCATNANRYMPFNAAGYVVGACVYTDANGLTRSPTGYFRTISDNVIRRVVSNVIAATTHGTCP